MRSGIGQIVRSCVDPVSLELFIAEPCFLSCGHTLNTETCNQVSKSANKTCPTCRAPLRRVAVDHKVNEIREILLKNIPTAVITQLVNRDDDGNHGIVLAESVIDDIMNKLKNALRCPMTNAVMNDAVTAPCGHSFSHMALEKMEYDPHLLNNVTNHNGTFECPHCKQLSKYQIVSESNSMQNTCLRNIASEYIQTLAQKRTKVKEKKESSKPSQTSVRSLLLNLLNTTTDAATQLMFEDPYLLECGHEIDKSILISVHKCLVCRCAIQRYTKDAIVADHLTKKICDILRTPMPQNYINHIFRNGKNFTDIVLDSSKEDDSILTAFLKNGQIQSRLTQAVTCPLAKKIMTSAVTSTCGHSFSVEGVASALAKARSVECPHCQQRFTKEIFFKTAVENPEKEIVLRRNYLLQAIAELIENLAAAIPKNSLREDILNDNYGPVFDHFSSHPEELEMPLFGPGQTLLHLIIAEGKVGLLIMMSEMINKLKVFIKKHNVDLLWLAVNSPNATPALLEELLNFGFDFAVTDTSDTILTLAIKFDRWDLVNALIASNKDLNINFKTKKNTLNKYDEATALLWAVTFDCPNDTFQQLLRVRGIDINAHTLGGLFPLYEAARRGDVEKVKMLQAAGCDLKKKCHGKTAYQIAQECHHGKVVEALTTRETICADIQKHIDAKRMDVAASVACQLYGFEGESFGIFVEIISKEFRHHRNSLIIRCMLRESFGIRELQKAENFPALADFLRGLRGSGGITLEFENIIFKAIAGGCIEFIDYLITNKVLVPQVLNKRGIPVVHGALVDRHDNTQMVELLIKRGFDPGIVHGQYQYKQTPLMRAILSTHNENYVNALVTAAIAMGADIKVNMQNDPFGMRAVTHAAGMIGIKDATFEQLLSIPDVDLVELSANGTNPLIQTILSGNEERAIRLLRERGVSNFVRQNAKQLRKIANDNGVAARLKQFFEAAPFVLANAYECLDNKDIDQCIGELMQYYKLTGAEAFFAAVHAMQIHIVNIDDFVKSIIDNMIKENLNIPTNFPIFTQLLGLIHGNIATTVVHIALHLYSKKMLDSLTDLISKFDFKLILKMLVGRREATNLILWMLKENIIPIEMPIVDGRTLFLLAVEIGNFNLVERMISGNDAVPVNINATVTVAAQSATVMPSCEGYTALMLAAISKSCTLPLFKKLCALPGLHVHAVNNRGESALVLAAATGDTGKVTALLYHPDKIDDISRHRQLNMAQDAAASYPDIKQLFELYYQMKTYLDMSDTTTEQGEKNFQAAALELAKLLNVNEKNLFRFIYNYLRNTYPAKADDLDRYLVASMQEAPYRYTNFVHQLITRLSEKINTPFLNGETILHIACRRGYLGLVTYLVLYCPQVDANARISNSNNPDYLATPILLAIRSSHDPYALCEVLMRLNHLSLDPDHRGQTPFMAALAFQNEVVRENLVTLFLNKAKDAFKQNLNEEQQLLPGHDHHPYVVGDTALIIATKAKLIPDLYRQLLRLPTTAPLAVNANGQTALDIAVEHHEQEVARAQNSLDALKFALEKSPSAHHITLLTSTVPDKLRLMKIYLARKNFKRVASIVDDIYQNSDYPIFDDLNKEAELYRDVAPFLMQRLAWSFIDGEKYIHILSLITMNPLLITAEIRGVPLIETAMKTNDLGFILALLRLPSVPFPPVSSKDENVAKQLPANARALLHCYRFIQALVNRAHPFPKSEFDHFFNDQLEPMLNIDMLNAIYKCMSHNFAANDPAFTHTDFDALKRVFTCLKVLLGDANAIPDKKHEKHATTTNEITDFYDFSTTLHRIATLAAKSKHPQVKKWKENALNCAYEILVGLLAGLQGDMNAQQNLLVKAKSLALFQPSGSLFKQYNCSDRIDGLLASVNQRISDAKKQAETAAMADDFVIVADDDAGSECAAKSPSR